MTHDLLAAPRPGLPCLLPAQTCTRSATLCPTHAPTRALCLIHREQHTHAHKLTSRPLSPMVMGVCMCVSLSLCGPTQQTTSRPLPSQSTQRSAGIPAAESLQQKISGRTHPPQTSLPILHAHALSATSQHAAHHTASPPMDMLGHARLPGQYAPTYEHSGEKRFSNLLLRRVPQRYTGSPAGATNAAASKQPPPST